MSNGTPLSMNRSTAFIQSLVVEMEAPICEVLTMFTQELVSGLEVGRSPDMFPYQNP